LERLCGAGRGGTGWGRVGLGIGVLGIARGTPRLDSVEWSPRYRTTDFQSVACADGARIVVSTGQRTSGQDRAGFAPGTVKRAFPALKDFQADASDFRGEAGPVGGARGTTASTGNRTAGIQVSVKPQAGLSPFIAHNSVGFGKLCRSCGT
jgi:hypothetical protein